MFVEYPTLYPSGGSFLSAFSSDLGYSLSDGSLIPGMVVNGANSLEDCRLRISNFDNRVGVICRSPVTNSNPDIYILNIAAPSSVITVYYYVSALYQDETNGFTWHSISIPNKPFYSGIVTTGSRAVAVSSTSVQLSSIWDFSNMLDTNIQNNDYFLVKFNNYQSALQLSTATINSGIQTMILFPISNYILIRKSSVMTPKISLKNPVFSAGDYSVTIYSYPSKYLTTVYTTNSIAITTGLLGSIAIIPGNSPRASSSTTLKFTLNFSDFIPLGGMIVIEFPNTYYSNIECDYCYSDFTDKDIDTAVTFTVSSTGSSSILTITNFQMVSVGTYNIYAVRASYAAAGISIIDIYTYADTSSIYAIDADSKSFTISSALPNLIGLTKFPRQSFMKGFQNPISGSYVDLEIFFTPSTDINFSGIDTIEIELPSSTN